MAKQVLWVNDSSTSRGPFKKPLDYGIGAANDCPKGLDKAKSGSYNRCGAAVNRPHRKSFKRLERKALRANARKPVVFLTAKFTTVVKMLQGYGPS